MKLHRHPTHVKRTEPQFGDPSDPVQDPPWPRHMPAGVKSWAVFQPNAPGGGEFRGCSAFGHRQLLKASGLYLAERVVIAVGSTEVALWPLLPGGFAGRSIGRWSSDRVLAFRVPATGGDEPAWPAFVLVDIGNARLLAELRAVRHDRPSEQVIRLLAAD